MKSSFIYLFFLQYSGVKQAVEDQQQPVGKMPDTRKMLVFILNLPFKNGKFFGFTESYLF